MNKELLNKMKTNWTGFGGLSEEMREAFAEHFKDAIFLSTDGTWCNTARDEVTVDRVSPCAIYRMPEDWQPPAEKKEPTYVEYDVEASSARHPKWIVPSLGKSLVEASGLVGFAGCKFDGQSATNHWSMNINSFITNTGSRVSTNNGHNHKPATPIKIRLMEEQS